ncbi:hypothetical protein LguiA_000653 [Lonicera macranthoides]
MSFQPIIFLLIVNILIPINGLNPRKLDEVAVPGSPNTDNKCGCTGCNNQCQSPPPPPPKKKPTPSKICPPPPPASSLIYMSGPPGNLYPVDTFPSGTSRSFAAGLPLLMGCGLLGVLAKRKMKLRRGGKQIKRTDEDPKPELIHGLTGVE